MIGRNVDLQRLMVRDRDTVDRVRVRVSNYFYISTNDSAFRKLPFALSRFAKKKSTLAEFPPPNVQKFARTAENLT